MLPNPDRRRAMPDTTAAEWQAWHAWHLWHELRLRYHETRDLWPARERAYLRYLRWLTEAGRLVEDGGPAVDGAEAPGR